MITWQEIKRVNDNMSTVDIDKKDKKSGAVKTTKYAMVKDKIAAFRELCPSGSIVTDILSMANGVVTIKATVSDEDGNILGTGLAQEKESNGFINANSFVENAETSAIGRGLSNCGFGLFEDGSYASAEEVANAILNQAVTDNEKTVLTELGRIIGESVPEILKKIGWSEGDKLTRVQYQKAIELIGAKLKKKAREE